jgi:hypothetical protein
MVKHEGFVDLLTDPQEAHFFLIDLTAALKSHGGELRVLVTASSAKGTYYDKVGQIAVLREPLEETEDTMLVLRPSGKGSLDVLQPQLRVRSTDPQSSAALEANVPDLRLASLPFVDVPGCGGYTVNGLDFIQKGFFRCAWVGGVY